MPIGVGAVIGIGASIVGGVLGSSSAKKAAAAAAREKARLQNKLSNLEKNRQDVVNPYEDFTNLSGMITNPFANLGVATGAAEIKIEEADLSPGDKVSIGPLNFVVQIDGVPAEIIGDQPLLSPSDGRARVSTDAADVIAGTGLAEPQHDMHNTEILNIFDE